MISKKQVHCTHSCTQPGATVPCIKINRITDVKDKAKRKQSASPIEIMKLQPIQMPHVDIDELKQGRAAFTQEEWMDILLRSIGMEPDSLKLREKWLLLTRMLPLVENNFNLCELGPRSTGKSHLFKEISPNSILEVLWLCNCLGRNTLQIYKSRTYGIQVTFQSFCYDGWFKSKHSST